MKEYRILSSITGGINETYKTIEELKERVNYIEAHKDEFKNNSMIYIYVNIYNEEGKITNNKTLKVIEY